MPDKRAFNKFSALTREINPNICIDITYQQLNNKLLQKRPLESEQFQVLLCYRIMLPQPTYVPNTKCYFKRSPYLDCYGHHISAGCANDGTLHKNHDAIKYVIKDLSNYSGFITRIEDIRCFQEAVPNSNLRPDISIYNFPIQPNTRNKLILDVSVTHHIPIISNRTLSRNEALQPCRAANRCYTRKQTKYMDISIANNLEFLPIIFERLLEKCIPKQNAL